MADNLQTGDDLTQVSLVIRTTLAEPRVGHHYLLSSAPLPLWPNPPKNGTVSSWQRAWVGEEMVLGSSLQIPGRETGRSICFGRALKGEQDSLVFSKVVWSGHPSS